MNIFTKLSLLLIIGLMVSISGCKPSSNSIYYYNVDEDTIAPEIKISVPLANDNYNLTYDVHIVGTVKDRETTYTGGQLKTLNINVAEIDPISGAVIKTLLNKNPVVDGKEGYTMNEKFVVNFAPSIVYCRLTVSAFDYTGRFDIKTVEFSID